MTTTPATAPAHSSDVAVDEGIAIVTMRRGDRHLLDLDLTRWLADTLAELESRDDVIAIVLTGADSTFCGGADGPLLRATGTAAPFADAIVDLFGAMPRMSTPVVAAVNGDALAGGFGLVCLADLVVAAAGSRLGTIEASLGTWPMLAQVPASRRVPQKPLVRNLLTGVPFEADEALRLGVVDAVVAPDAVLATAREFAVAATAGGAAARIGLPAYYAALETTYDEALAAGAATFTAQFSRPS